MAAWVVGGHLSLHLRLAVPHLSIEDALQLCALSLLGRRDQLVRLHLVLHGGGRLQHGRRLVRRECFLMASVFYGWVVHLRHEARVCKGSLLPS